MHPSITRLAAAATPRGLRPTPMALLPPIPLYRRLLRAHRKHLPSEMRLLGDEYIKAEFRAHRKVDNPAHLVCNFSLPNTSPPPPPFSLPLSLLFSYPSPSKVDMLTKPSLQIGFLTEWQLYAQKVEGDSWKGEKIEEGKLQKLSDEQVHQLYELMQAIQNRGEGESES
ncbi:regulatory protein [Geosmithia morbida]|uniref:Succinate dehydrogenase assembly factor 3 n=1 Tax=Geosmithia morbida TaxID=1094350 RepID=A0A9P5D4A6_9HYPO|nr:regulatory protein [Geosmithia morbida]KAF4123331.1 regulatory protein [Geosmithia morbida]